MANVFFWSRLSNLWSGFMSLWLEDIEKKQPEIAYENAVQSMTEKYVKLKRATAAIIRRREELESQFAAEQKELNQLTADLNAAIDTNQDELGVVLIQKKNALTASIAAVRRVKIGFCRMSDISDWKIGIPYAAKTPSMWSQ